ncbi:outer membrane beta-barrel protein [Bdellovibrio sp. 22V]|uniref:outer membrane beta-barrel protein n=1 Tax=Bdellovibrio TaxID=958 RepID=UPI002543E898|nr:outer membrane beta-barrel protein [Bdellovibrio sp. 22V]WII73107.1 outer membrane beta-barrel protein [Bdellovibrio sp. 22V]
MKLFTLSLLALMFTVTAQAQSRNYASSSYYGGSYTHEILTSFTQGSFVSGKECEDCDSSTNLTLQASYLQTWKNNMQWGFEGGIRMLSEEISGTGSSETLFQIVALGVYNFDNDMKNAIYAKAGIGLYPILERDAGGNDYENQFGFFLGIGKRFAWLNNVSYTPELRMVKRGDIDIGFQIDVLQFSIYW